MLSGTGAKLVISARNEHKLRELQLTFRSVSIEVLPLDVEDFMTLSIRVNEAWKFLDGFDYVFLNAGMSVRDLVSDTQIEVERKIMDINFWGPVAITRELLRKRNQESELHLVLTSSLSGKYGVPKLASYTASKHAMQGYFDSLRAETHGAGIFIHLVIPGFVRTDITVAGLRGDGSTNGRMQEALAGGMDPVDCAKGILSGLERGKEEFVVGGFERFTVLLNRLFPRLMKKIIRSNPLQHIKKFQRSWLGK
ncbi:SDR family NAD(P)-dependent oxidoreductase [Algoriphagus jejuensis]|uniref:SDR family NAD(P)-dependent oxidoreductase n=2 Tax=Algoriphagus jejuensis TaxID=419934 RepID=A0ABP3Y907_9BACT